MIKTTINGRKLIIKIQYGPAGVNKQSLRKAVKRLEKLKDGNGNVSFAEVEKLLSTVQIGQKKMIKVPVDETGNIVEEVSDETSFIDTKAPAKFTRRTASVTIYEETIQDEQIVLNPILSEKVVNDSKDAFERNYGRTLAIKKAAFRIAKEGIAGFDSTVVQSIEEAFKTAIPKSAETWDGIDNDYVERLLF